MIDFLYTLHRHLWRTFILIPDRYGVHRKAVRLLQEAGVDWFAVERSPAYAPELSPVEMVGNHTRYGNGIPEDIVGLAQAVTNSINEARRVNRLKRSFFAYQDRNYEPFFSFGEV